MRIKPAQRGPLPGFGMTLGLTVFYLGLVVLLPLSTLIFVLSDMSAELFWRSISSPRVSAALQLSFGTSLVAALLNVIFGLLIAWVLVRYHFPLRRFLDALIDLPLALPTAVAGIALTAIYSPTGWIGELLAPFGVVVAFSRAGVLLALMFVGLPFVVRSVQPVLEALDPEMEQAAASIGASPITTFFSVVFPSLWPSLLTGFSLAFARALGEYGSVVFISGNLPLRTEIVPLLIMSRLEQFDYQGAAALAIVMLGSSFLLLLIVNSLQFWTAKRLGNAP